jgi:hypothetical protein
MGGILLIGAGIALLCWGVMRAKQRAAERAASGVLRTPLYWIANVLALCTLGLAMYMARLGALGIDRWLWFAAIALFAMTIVARLTLKRRHFI